MTYAHLEGWWTDAGTFDSLLRAGNLVARSRPAAEPAEEAQSVSGTSYERDQLRWISSWRLRPAKRASAR